MARYSRRFTLDKTTGKWKDTTEPEVAAVLDEIEATTNPFKRELFSEDSLPGKRTRRAIAKWPLTSLSAAINAEDVGEQRKFLRERGVDMDYEITPECDTAMPIFRDRAHRRKFCEATGFIDRDGGYGDFTG